jgi:flagellar protein FliO/FliZ
MRFPGLPKPLPYFCRALKAAAACLLFSHAAAFSQGAAAPAASPAASTTAAVTLPRTIPFKQDSALASGDGGPSLTAIALVLATGLAGFAAWVWRNRRPPAGAENTLKRSGWWGGAFPKDVLNHGTTRLSPKHSVHDIEWRGRRLLIGCTDQAMTLLSERDAAEPPADANAPGRPAPAPREPAP